ncbi:MAG: hypothetical protein A2566_02665 [Candidatus Zambryskibacteria bacterium RIFOXYD1_FULL_40_13]|nr:MAG: hypothetical protein UU06_C0003G0020 [Parcubacteria group bacterium GW2011_GWB1_40_5]KKR81400.1 MAG: hypothetical protein UU27_C0014G0017 [Parcubacteria group bacterium GW2011_GWD1_40_9]OHA87910.1 MAG: hypothetical protein A2123_03050 [Candidatus Zambryskibacteria bacterium GWB1_40_5]OHB15044.1 MAG: hypothetical protein A2566_02665 [Candidatus Zambryskibacteria bacterium RIFOXYD1_FULL_40_13]HBD24600.1 hypothetical protein [Candidatus Zambryskibacteria bacterium]
MPKLDGTGPMGQGARAGQGLGLCGMGIRQGWGFRGAWCPRRFISPKNEIMALEDEEKILEEELVAIRKEKQALKEEQK